MTFITYPVVVLGSRTNQSTQQRFTLHVGNIGCCLYRGMVFVLSHICRIAGLTFATAGNFQCLSYYSNDTVWYMNPPTWPGRVEYPTWPHWMERLYLDRKDSGLSIEAQVTYLPNQEEAKLSLPKKENVLMVNLCKMTQPGKWSRGRKEWCNDNIV